MPNEEHERSQPGVVMPPIDGDPYPAEACRKLGISPQEYYRFKRDLLHALSIVCPELFKHENTTGLKLVASDRHPTDESPDDCRESGREDAAASPIPAPHSGPRVLPHGCSPTAVVLDRSKWRGV